MNSLSASRGGVQVYKSVEVEGVRLPTVLYALQSEREQPISVRMVDPLPSGVPPEAIAVHDDFDGDGWELGADGRLAYSRELEPGEMCKTALFVGLDAGRARRFSETPRVEDVRPLPPKIA